MLSLYKILILDTENDEEWMVNLKKLIYDLSYMDNFVNTAVQRAKVNYYTDRFQRSENDLKRTWNDLRRLVSLGGKRSEVIHVRREGTLVTNPKEVARLFNEYFGSIADRVEALLPESSQDPLAYVPRNDHSMYMETVTEEEVCEIVLSLKNTKYDLDTLPVHILKMFIPILKYPVTSIINMSISTGVFPNALKNAIVVPIFKKGDKCELSNYRPISILPILSKILEKCVAKQLISFTDRFSIINKNQFGFQKRLSTVDAVVEFSEFICNKLESREHVLSILIDYSRAFDTVNHNILLQKLEVYGIRGIVNDWFRSYLSSRRQRVKLSYASCYSDFKCLSVGVPQGSVLGPILFVLYINEFSNVCPLLKTVLFADDTTVACSGSDFIDMCSQTSNHLETISAWSNSNRLMLNSDKTCAIVFSNRLRDDELLNAVLSLNSVSIDFRDEVKFLGVNLDSKLKFREHINFVCNKLSRVVGILSKVREVLSRKALISLYYSLFYPYLIYCNVLWAGTYSTHLHNIEMLQKRAIRIISGSEYLAHTTPLFYDAGILKAVDVHRLLLLLYYFRNREKFGQSNVAYETRHAHAPVVPVHRLTLTEHSVSYASAREFRSLPLQLKTIDSYHRFKRAIKKHFLAQYSEM